MENLNDKSWYRLLKVIYIVIFTSCLIGVISLFSEFQYNDSYIKCDNGKEFSYPTLFRGGDANKLCDPNFELPKNLPFNFETWANHRILTRPHYNTIQLIGFDVLSVFITLIIFWLISRVFFYVVAKDKFISGRLVNIINGIFIKK